MTDVDRLIDGSNDGLLGLLAHDLRAPLAPLSLAASWLASDTESSEDARALARIADSQGDKMRRLIDAALAASGRRPNMRLEEMSLADVMRDAEHAHRALGGEASSIPSDALIVGDRSLLRDAFANLMECAAGEGGTAEVWLEGDDRHARAVFRCRDVEDCARALRVEVPSDALSAFLLGSKAVLELHDGGLELTDLGLIAWIPVAAAW